MLVAFSQIQTVCIHHLPRMYDEQPSVSLCAKDQAALQFPVPSIFPHANALRAVLLSCGSQRSVSCFLFALQH